MTAPKLTFESGVGSVTGANFLLEASGRRLLVDCGMIQGERVATDENRQPFPYDPSSIDTLLVTHAHLDHVGRIPKLVKEGFRGRIWSTPETKALAQLILEDAVGILDQEARQAGLEPLYDRNDAAAAFPLWQTVPYQERPDLGDGISACFKDAGHILGSAMIEVSLTGGPGTKILFTGDLGNSPSPLLRDTEEPGNVDYLVMESVYGDRNHEPKEERDREFERIVRETAERGGTLVIPAFSVERTQVMLYELNNLAEAGKLPNIPVFVDSPLASRVTEVYRAGERLFNDRIQAQIGGGDNIFSFQKLSFTVSRWESSGIEHHPGPKIILAGSGMSAGGRVVSHEARYIPEAKNTILLPGYQAAGSLGRELADGARSVRINGRTIPVRARIETIYGYSAHKDSDRLVAFAAQTGPRLRRIFTVMGEPRSCMHLAQRINDETGKRAMMPERGKAYDLD